MRKAILAAGLVVLWFACGSSTAPSIDPAMTGVWTGMATISDDAGNTGSDTQDVAVVVDGGTATVANICPLDGAGLLTVTGSGDSASWSGSYTGCEPLSLEGCATIPVTYKGLTVSLAASTLTIHGSGTLDECGVTQNFTMDFSGLK